ncbi:2-oxoacid:acceptor oxidoreductase subunit alpha [Methanosphaerula palustris]|nr:2-oxoacid:acceptor oxidoreductase subunit alpha [Methanosphaerula palustris]
MWDRHEEVSVLIGGRAGEGINKASTILAHLLGHLGYRIYMYYDYPSLIRGGHNFAIIRATAEERGTHQDAVDFLLCMNQETQKLHEHRIREGTVVIFDSTTTSGDGIGVPLTTILKEEQAPEISRNSGIIGAFCRAAGITWEVVTEVFTRDIPKAAAINLKVARRGYDAAGEGPVNQIQILDGPVLPAMTGNEAIGAGLVRGGLETYISYPMTPSSSILHFLAEVALEYRLTVIHPENEIAVMLMALGAVYAGSKTAVGTAGGGFCLMTEGLSMAGMTELPIVLVVSQRPGPSTGLPTYSSQTDLLFVLNAGQGEFARVIIAPADAEEAYLWSARAVSLAWDYQVPVFLLSDKNLSEGLYSLSIDPKEQEASPVSTPDTASGPYRRYAVTESGVSPLRVVPSKGDVIKVNSYEHDEEGITTEDPQVTVMMQQKRLRKEGAIRKGLELYPTVRVYGDPTASIALVTWGSSTWAVREAAATLGCRVIQPVVLWPFPLQEMSAALQGATRRICIEQNASGQLEQVMTLQGFATDGHIRRYDGRPWSIDEMKIALSEVL